jgi:hypothetical protein
MKFVSVLYWLQIKEDEVVDTCSTHSEAPDRDVKPELRSRKTLKEQDLEGDLSHITLHKTFLIYIEVHFSNIIIIIIIISFKVGHTWHIPIQNFNF